MMILPLADALQNCLQDLTSRIAGMDNEQMAGRAMGMGPMLGYGIGAIKEQFNSPNSNNNTSQKSDGTKSSNGFTGFVDRAKQIINPNMNLSAEKDYNGNTNPIREVIQTKSNNIVNPNSMTFKEYFKGTNSSNKETIKQSKTTIAKNVARTAFTGTKAYLSIGAHMAEGDFNRNTFKNPNANNKKNNFHYTEHINNISNNNAMQKLGDENEFKENS